MNKVAPHGQQCWLRLCLLLASLLLASSPSYAHETSIARITLSDAGGTLKGEWLVSVVDLNKALALDSNSDQKITWSELKSRRDDIEDLLGETIFVSDGASGCQQGLGDLMIEETRDQTYAVISFDMVCATDLSQGFVNYRFLENIDSLHLGIYTFDLRGTSMTGVFSRDARRVELAARDAWQVTLAFVKQGVYHILIGIDHLLFLAVLIIPFFLLAERDNSLIDGVRRCGRDILKYTLTFTVAHSITLALAALEFLKLPAALTESAIALTVAIGAWNIVRRNTKKVALSMVFLFGLIHGVGFASVFSEMLTNSRLLHSLLSFNLGVEIGQALFILVLLPILHYVLRVVGHKALSTSGVLILGISVVWIFDRLSGVLPG